MSIVALPCEPGSAHYSFATDLEGITYGFEFRWNSRDSAWYMSIFTGDDERILSGVKVVANWPLAMRSADARMPPGRFIAFDTSGGQLDPGENDLGERVKLLYFDSTEEL